MAARPYGCFSKEHLYRRFCFPEHRSGAFANSTLATGAIRSATARSSTGGLFATAWLAGCKMPVTNTTPVTA